MEKDIAIKVEGVSKTFRIPHEKITSLKSAFVSLFGERGYEEFKALDDVSFEVKKGEFFGIIGRNGSGKSTLLKILAGIYKPDQGKVKINGLISPFLELGIGFNPELSGRDNIYLNATVLGLSQKQIDEKFDDIVEFSELRRFIDQKVKNYSSGMQVRLAFSVAIHANRDILLMDEVLAVGDSNFQSKCIEEFEKYRKDGKTVALVTHDIETVREYCDRAILLDNGSIVKIGKASDVVNMYINKNIQELNEKNKNPSYNANKNSKGYSLDERVQRYGNGKALIEKIEIFNHENKESLSLESGTNFKIKLLIKFFQDVEHPVFAFILKDNFDKGIFGMHSSYSRNPIKIRKINKGENIEVTFEGEMLLTQGSYKLNIACSNLETHLKYETLDSREDALKIQVYSNKTLWSYINSENKIRIKGL